MEKKNAQGAVISRDYVARPIIKANNAKEVEIFEDEAHLVHLRLAVKHNDPIKKEYVEHSNTQSFTRHDYDNMKNSGFFNQYDSVEILHHPDMKKGEALEPGKGSAPTDDAAALAAKELADLRAKYGELYGNPAPEGASIQDLRELIDVKANQIAQERAAQIMSELDSLTDEELTAEYKKIAKKQANEDATVDQKKSVVLNARMKK